MNKDRGVVGAEGNFFWIFNINSLPSKFEQLKIILGNFLDILIIQETKLDHSFPTEQFLING